VGHEHGDEHVPDVQRGIQFQRGHQRVEDGRSDNHGPDVQMGQTIQQ